MEGTSGQELARLVECFRAAGTPYAGHGADPIDLDREDGIWLVERGSVDVFVTQTEGGRHAAPLKHLLRAESGELLFGAAPAASGRLRLRAKVSPDTILHCAKRGPWLRAVEDMLPERVDTWLEKISLAIAEDVPEHRRPDTLLHPGEPLEAGEGAVLSSARGVVWASVDGQAAFVDTQHEVGEAAAWIPVSTRTWLRALGECRGAVRSSVELMDRGRLFDALAEFHRLFIDIEELNRMLAVVDSANLQRERTARRRRQAERAAEELARTVNPELRQAHDSESELMAVLDAIGRWEGIRFRSPGAGGRGAGKKQSPVSLADILDTSEIRARRGGHRIKRVFRIDTERCAKCAGRVRIIATHPGAGTQRETAEHCGGRGTSYSTVAPIQRQRWRKSQCARKNTDRRRQRRLSATSRGTCLTARG